MQIVTTVEAAKRYGTSPSAISRAAKRAGIGIRREDGRLVGINSLDLPAVKKLLHFKAGNPTFIKSKTKNGKKRDA
jgi:hypothetical protein